MVKSKRYNIFSQIPNTKYDSVLGDYKCKCFLKNQNGIIEILFVDISDLNFVCKVDRQFVTKFSKNFDWKF